MGVMTSIYEQLMAEQAKARRFASMYSFIPYTIKNIGKNYFKMGRGPKRHQLKKGLAGCPAKHPLPEVNITPRPNPNSFTSDRWDPAFKHMRRETREDAKTAITQAKQEKVNQRRSKVSKKLIGRMRHA